MLFRDRLFALREPLYAAADANGAKEIRVFGSVARGEEREGSDVDFLVSLEAGRTLLDLAQLEIRFEQILGRPVDVVTENSLREPLRSAALREALDV